MLVVLTWCTSLFYRRASACWRYMLEVHVWGTCWRYLLGVSHYFTEEPLHVGGTCWRYMLEVLTWCISLFYRRASACWRYMLEVHVSGTYLVYLTILQKSLCMLEVYFLNDGRFFIILPIDTSSGSVLSSGFFSIIRIMFSGTFNYNNINTISVHTLVAVKWLYTVCLKKNPKTLWRSWWRNDWNQEHYVVMTLSASSIGAVQ